MSRAVTQTSNSISRPRHRPIPLLFLSFAGVTLFITSWFLDGQISLFNSGTWDLRPHSISAAVANVLDKTPWCTVDEASQGQWIPLQHPYTSIPEYKKANQLPLYNLTRDFAKSDQYRNDGLLCPGQGERYPGNDRILDVSSYSWQPEAGCKLKPFNRAAFVRRLVSSRGGMLMVGDSVQSQFLDAIAVLLGNQGPIYEEFHTHSEKTLCTRTFYIEPRHPEAHSILGPLHLSAAELRSNLTFLTYIRDDMGVDEAALLALGAKYDPPVKLNWFWSGTCTWWSDVEELLAKTMDKSDAESTRNLPMILLFNVGAHWGARIGLTNRELGYKLMVEDIIANVTARSDSIEFIHRSLGTPHLDCGNYRAPSPGLTLEQDNLPYYWVQIDEMNRAAREAITEAPRRPDGRPAAHYLDVWNPTYDRPDMHKYPWAEDGADCLHFCIADPTLEWVRLLWHLIDRQQI